VPVQWKAFLGDWPTLRGWNARTLAGEEAAWASLDIRFGFDLFRAMRMPLLKKWGLQPLVLFDWGTVTALDGPQEQPWPDGWRANAGFGFGKLLGIPGYKGNVRLYVSHPVLESVDQGGWRVLLVFENY
jgi:hemolysin activation/secretion protein